MSKKVSEILNSDIQVPEIVQKKADAAFSQIQSERETNMGKKNLKVTKLFVAMAACAAFIIVASTTNNYLNRPQEEKETTVAECKETLRMSKKEKSEKNRKKLRNPENMGFSTFLFLKIDILGVAKK